MWCDQQFVKFDERLRLDQSRRERIERELNRFKEVCQQDEQLRAGCAGSPFLQGSVPSNTVIRPIGNDEYDVDVIYPLRLDAWKPESRAVGGILDWFKKRLQIIPAYAGGLELKNRCVRVNFSGDFHVDIIPSAQGVLGHQPWAVPARDLKDWVTNDPLGLVDWIRARDSASGMPRPEGGAFVRSVRYMKRWRDHWFGTDPRPSSILLTTILGKHEASVKLYSPALAGALYPQHQHDSAYLYDLLRLTHGCIQNPQRDAFEHPTIGGEDLRRDWDAEFTKRFIERLAASIHHLDLAIKAMTDHEAVTQFKAALGESFPGV